MIYDTPFYPRRLPQKSSRSQELNLDVALLNLCIGLLYSAYLIPFNDLFPLGNNEFHEYMYECVAGNTTTLCIAQLPLYTEGGLLMSYT